jgi:DNA-binding NarL/FixJ family response regulator
MSDAKKEVSDMIEPDEIWTLQPTSILLVTSNHIGWAGLRSILLLQRGVRIVGDTCQRSSALELAEFHHPDVIATAADSDDARAMEWAAELGFSSPTSKLIVLVEDVDYLRLFAVTATTHVSGYILWRDLKPASVHHFLGLIREATFKVTSSASDQLMNSALPQENRRQEVTLTLHEQEVLGSLSDGLTEREISAHRNLSRPTVARSISSLKMKLDARTLFHLGLQAEAYGLSSLLLATETSQGVDT